jgi:hypothetical protein
LSFALFAVAVIAEGGQFIAAPLKIAAGDIVKKENIPARPCRRRKHPILNTRLIRIQPVQIGVQIIFVKTLHTENITGGVTGSQAYRRESRALIDHASDDLPEGQLALAGGTQCRLDAQLPGHIVDGPDGPKDDP